MVADRLPPAPPTKDYIEKMALIAIAEFQDDNKEITRLRQIRRQARKIPIDPDMRFVDMESHSPDLADEGFRVAQALSINPVRVKFTPYKKGVQVWEQLADKLGRWAEGFMHDAGKKHAGEATTYAVVDATVNDGGGWHKLIYAPEDWELRDTVSPIDYTDPEEYLDAVDEAGQGSVPMRWLPVDAITVNPHFSHGRLVRMLEMSDRPFWEVLDEFGLEPKDNTSGDFVRPIHVGEPQGLSEVQVTPMSQSLMRKRLRVVEFWDEWYYSVLVIGPHSSYSTDPKLHGLNIVPYFYSPGLLMNEVRGHKTAVSAGQLKSWLVEYKDFLRTLNANAAARDVFTTLHRERPPDGQMLMGDDGRPITETDYTLGVIIEGGLGEKISAIQFPNVSPAIQNELQAVNADLARFTTPSVRSDIGSAAMEGAGFAISQVIAEAKIQHAQFARHIQDSFHEMIEHALWLVKNVVKDTVYVESTAGDGYIGIGPADLEHKMGFTVMLDPEQPSAKLIENRYWNERLTAGTAYKEQAINAQGDDASEVKFMQMLEAMELSPWFTQLYQQSVVQELGQGDLLSQAYAAQQLAKTGGDAQQPGGMGNQIVPDMGNAALRTTRGTGGGAPDTGPGAGQGPGAVLPAAGAAAGISPGGL